MTKREYAAYVERVEFYLKGLEFVSTGPCPGCEECAEFFPDGQDGESVCEPWFSWSPCEICNRPLGGNREPWHGVLDGEIVHGSCCVDCVYFLNYGQLDDMTMDEIESSN